MLFSNEEKIKMKRMMTSEMTMFLPSYQNQSLDNSWLLSMVVSCLMLTSKHQELYQNACQEEIWIKNTYHKFEHIIILKLVNQSYFFLSDTQYTIKILDLSRQCLYAFLYAPAFCASFQVLVFHIKHFHIIKSGFPINVRKSPMSNRAAFA